MKKGLILINAYMKAELYKNQFARLKEELENLGVTVDVLRNNSFAAFIDNGKLTADIKNYDFCIYLDKDRYMSKMLEKAGLRLFNCHDAIEACDDKMVTHILLANCGIKMPKTLGGLLCYLPQSQLNTDALDLVIGKLGLPLVVKESYGSFGKNVFKVNSKEELVSIAEKLKCRPHLYQQFIQSSYGKDVRVIVIGGKVVGGMMRQSQNDFRSNIDLGGTASPFNLPDSFVYAAEKVASILNLDFCGIDFLFGENGEPLLCEVNSNALFEAFEEATGINVAGLYARHIVKTIYGI